MERILSCFLLSAICFTSSAQTVEVQGKLKVSDMQIENTDELLVTRKEDGTLGTRQASSILPPTDTMRTFERDLQLAKHICECSSLSPFLVESALNNGYTEENLLAAGVDPTSIYSGGGDPLQLLAAGVSPVVLVAAGAPDSLFLGLEYDGGYIFHLDGTTGFGLVASGALLAVNNYGCNNMDLPAAEGLEIGEGAANTLAIVNACGTETTAYFINNYTYNSYNDWYIPSVNELLTAYNVLVDIPGSQFDSDQGLQSSTDFPGTINTDQCLGVFYPENGPEAIILPFLKDPGGAVVFTTFIRTIY